MIHHQKDLVSSLENEQFTVNNQIILVEKRLKPYNFCLQLSECCSSYLLQSSTPGAQEDHTVSIVDIGSDRGQPVPALSEHCLTRHQLGTPQGLVYIQSTEVIINGNRLWGER